MYFRNEKVGHIGSNFGLLEEAGEEFLLFKTQLCGTMRIETRDRLYMLLPTFPCRKVSNRYGINKFYMEGNGIRKLSPEHHIIVVMN